jgi:hypothetical protein
VRAEPMMRYTVATWSPGRMVAWSRGRVVAWSHGRMVAWSHGRMVTCAWVQCQRRWCRRCPPPGGYNLLNLHLSAVWSRPARCARPPPAVFRVEVATQIVATQSFLVLVAGGNRPLPETGKVFPVRVIRNTVSSTGKVTPVSWSTTTGLHIGPNSIKPCSEVTVL